MPGPIDYMKEFDLLMASTEQRAKESVDALTPLEEKTVKKLMKNKRLIAKGISLEKARRLVRSCRDIEPF